MDLTDSLLLLRILVRDAARFKSELIVGERHGETSDSYHLHALGQCALKLSSGMDVGIEYCYRDLCEIFGMDVAYPGKEI